MMNALKTHNIILTWALTKLKITQSKIVQIQRNKDCKDTIKPTIKNKLLIKKRYVNQNEFKEIEGERACTHWCFFVDYNPLILRDNLL